MANVTEKRLQIEYHKTAAHKLREAYIAIVESGVQMYTIGSRSLTRLDLAKISDEIKMHEKKVSELEGELAGRARRRAVGVIPRDW